jgi:serine/threonine protein kinase
VGTTPNGASWNVVSRRFSNAHTFHTIPEVKGFLWCPHCGSPHALTAAACPTTGMALQGQPRLQSSPEMRRVRPPPVGPALPTLDPPSIEVGEIIEGRYKVGPLIGRGGFGTVYEAENLSFGGRVALKMLERSDPGTVRRFNQEARIAGTILHPNVCRVFDVGRFKEKPFIVMELLSGENLGARLERKGPLKVGNAIDIAIQVLAGLGAAHEMGVVHRDVKPQNVFLVARQGCSPMVKLLDFGLAKALSKDARPTTTMAGKIVGTIAYMSPEQLHAERIDARSDLFSSAVLLYEAITGVLPWPGRTPADIGAAILRDPPKPLAEHLSRFPRELEAILALGLMKDRSRRFQSAMEFMRALGVLQRTQPGIVPFAVSPGTEDEATTHIAWREGFGAEDAMEDDAPTNITPPRALTPQEQGRAKIRPAHLDAVGGSSDTTEQHRPFLRPQPGTLVPRLYTIPPSSRGPPSRNGRRRGSSS